MSQSHTPLEAESATPKKPSLYMVRSRLYVLQIGILLCFGVLFAVLVQLSMFRDPDTAMRGAHGLQAASRGEILDRNGVSLARTLSCMAPYVDVAAVKAPHLYAAAAKHAYPKLDETQFARVLNARLQKGRKGLIRLASFVTPVEHQRLHDSALPGLSFLETDCRLYSLGEELAHVVGTVRRDRPEGEQGERLFGERGLEAYFDSALNKGQTIQTTLHSQVQSLTANALQSAMRQYRARSGAAIVLDVRYGEIVAMASAPTFDPHNRYAATDRRLINAASAGVYELGSMFKPLTVAIALKAGAASLGDVFDVTKPIVINGKEISDVKPLDHPLNIPAVLMHSSNIGAARISQTFTPKMHREFFQAFGLSRALDLELPSGERATPLFPKKWTRTTSISASYGYGVGISPLHMVTAISSLVNGGYPVSPTLVPVSGERRQMLQMQPRIFSGELSRLMRQLLYISAVGSARRSQVPGYFVSGKTGTANRLIDKNYSSLSSRSSFTGVFPGYNPKYAVIVMIDDPRNKSNTGEAMMGSLVAAPVVAQIISQAAPLLDVRPRAARDVEVINALVPPVSPNTERGQRIYARISHNATIMRPDAQTPSLHQASGQPERIHRETRSLRAIISEGAKEESQEESETERGGDASTNRENLGLAELLGEIGGNDDERP